MSDEEERIYRITFPDGHFEDFRGRDAYRDPETLTILREGHSKSFVLVNILAWEVVE
ncbi:MAG: hypothetical protein J2P43_01265 [Candidatus Dormibacteraeota bacterium]|nr:hypothetical protein [Candidatus Dormibacteraeota bacterium]